MGGRSANWVQCGAANQQIEIGAIGGERIVCRRTEFVARLPPSVLTYDNACIDAVVEFGTRTNASFGRLDRDPIAIADATRGRCNWVQNDLGRSRVLAQTWQDTVLRLTEHRWLRTSQDQWEPRSEVRTRSRPDLRLFEIGQWCIAVVEKGLGIKLDAPRRCRKAIGHPF